MRIKTWLGLLIVALLAGGFAFGGKRYVDSAKEEFAAAEEALPESAISAYFAHIREHDYDGIYEDSMIVNPHINSKEDYIARLEEIYEGVDTSKIEYAGLDNTDGSRDYKLYYDQQFLATLKLMKAADGSWMASTIFSGDLSYIIEVPTDVTITANGVAIGPEYMIQEEVTASNFTGLNDTSSAPKVNVYQLDNLLGAPVIEVTGQSGYGTLTDVLTGRIFVGKTVNDAELSQTMIDDAEIIAKWPAQEASLGQVAAVSVTTSDWYSRVSGVQNQWFTAHGTSSFSNQKAFNIIQQSEDSMVGYVTFDYYASNGEVSRTWNGGYQMSFLNVNGTWKIAGMAIDNELNPNKVTPLQN
ncbi:MAG: hypothetical protein IJ225_03015 [Solobacterium sp.]|nr:hypothetical protein [Solobacterium sp.]